MMSMAGSYPGVYIEETSSGVRTVTGIGTSTALFIGWAPRGPTDRALRLTSFADYERAYGGLDARSLLSYAARQFYANGGSDAYFVRIVDTEKVAAAPAIAGAKTAAVAIKVGSADLAIHASSPGAWANDYKVRTTVDGPRFKLDVFDPAGDMVETFVNLSMDPADPRVAPSIINGKSAYIDALSIVTPSAASASSTQVSLVGGQDGQVLDPTNDSETVFQTQVDALFTIGGIADRIDLFNIICVPGLKHAATIEKLQAHAKTNRAFLIIDGAEDDTFAAPGTPPRSADAHCSAYYFPWMLAPDPLMSNAVRAFPPSGFVAGVYARIDALRGVWKAPAGTDASITGAVGPKINLSDAQNGQLNPLGINCLRAFPVYGNIVWGARTLNGEDGRGSQWKYVPVRRTALFLEESLYRGTQWVVFEPNDEPLWAQVRLSVGDFLHGLFRQGAFQGRTPQEAYFVKCDRETTTQADINLGIVNFIVGFAPLKPAEFVILKIQQIAGEVST